MALNSFLARISGSDSNFELEHRVFNTLTFSTTLLCVFAFFSNMLLGLSLVGSLLALIGAIISFSLFYFSRIKNKLNSFMLIVMIGFALLFIVSVYPSDSGSKGPLAFVFISLVHVFIVISKESLQLKVFFSMVFTIVLLYAIEYLFPHLIHYGYNNEGARLLDFAITMIYSLFFVLITTLTFKRSYNRERTRVNNQNGELQNLNKKLSEKTAQIEMLMKELSHRVKNNLQVVTSLLNLQSNRIKDPDAKAAVLDGRNRLLSMVLLHQKLYVTDKPTIIDMKEYIIDLTNNLVEANKLEVTKKVVFNLEQIFLKIETAVPLGLIINELITNSLKYAFEIDSPADELRVTFEKQGVELVLTVADNGKGFVREPSTNSFGLQLVDSLVSQLEGSFSMDSSNGTITVIKMKTNDES
jgi:two-component sensor histidine kinase